MSLSQSVLRISALLASGVTTNQEDYSPRKRKKPQAAGTEIHQKA